MSEDPDDTAPDDLNGDQILTQYGMTMPDGTAPFHNEPREGKENELSLLEGQLKAEEAARYVLGNRRALFKPERHKARYTTVSELQTSGFTVTRSPSKKIPIHVSVGCDAEWDEATRIVFDSCFVDSM